MADEAILRVKLEDPVPFTVADGTGIEKGAILQLTDPRTAQTNVGQGAKLAGICAYEKVASDGRTEIGSYIRGIFDMTCSGNVALGAPLTAYLNRVETPTTFTASGLNIIGCALETGTDGEVIQVLVNLSAAGTIKA